MNIAVRQAHPEDAQGIRLVAESLSKVQMEAAGASMQDLSAQGFLLYPLAADDASQPNYLSRIENNPHFWVAKEKQKIVAFMMAYSFERMRKLAQLTTNDQSLIEFFTKTMGALDSNVYVAQVGTHPDYKRKGIISSIMREAFKPENTGGSPAAFAEIAQYPLKNIASTRTFEQNGFSMVFTRVKDTHKRPEEHRISGTFVRSFAPG